MELQFHGVRGSYPTPGKQFSHYGGNTPCVSILLDQNTLLIIDAGTGIINLGHLLNKQQPPFDRVNNYHIFMSHFHLDHLQGLPFFSPLWMQPLPIYVHSVKSCSKNFNTAQHVLDTTLMTPPLFPLGLDQTRAPVYFHEHHKDACVSLTPSHHMTFCKLNHPGGAWGVKILWNEKKVCYISDHESGNPSFDTMLTAFCDQASLVILDTMYTPEDYEKHIGWGHSSHAFANELQCASKAHSIALFHHAPFYTDTDIHKFQDEFSRHKKSIYFAKENECLSF